MRLITTAAMCVALLLAGCGSDEPTPKEPKATSSPTAAIEPPEMPEQAKEDSDEGAAAFALHFARVMHASARSGDSAPLRALSSRNCTECNRMSEAINAIYEAGGYLQTSAWELRDLKAGTNGDSGTVTAHVHTAEGKFRSSAQQAEMVDPEADHEVTFRLLRADGNWQMASITRVEQ